jgi:cyclohexadieny/prephenate dehydrogenase
MNSSFKKISILGLGLIGTSILHAIKKKLDKEIITFAYDIESEHRNIVSEMGIATFVCDNISEAVKDAELVILAIPVGAMETVARLISPHLKPNTLITDTGSTKASVIKDVNTYLPENVFFIPSHPIAGTEYSGPKAGFSSLFENRYWLLVSEIETENSDKLSNFFTKLGSKVEIVSIEYHDRILAITSHLPHLIAYTIVGTASDLETDLKNDVIKYSASGFRDFTRIASSNPIMWRDIFLNNSEAVLEMLQRFNEDLSDLQKAIRKKDGKKLESFFSRTRKIRKKIIDAGQL